MSYARFAQTVSPLSYRPPSPPKPKGPWGKPHRWSVSPNWICYPQQDKRNDDEIWYGCMISCDTGTRMDNTAWYIHQLTLMEAAPQ